MSQPFVIAIAISLVTACSSSGGDSGSVADAGYGESFRIDWGPVTVEPGQEDTLCVVKRLSNDRPIRVGKFINDLGNASHHLIVYRLAEGEEIHEPTPCDPFEDVLDPTRGAPLNVTQKEYETITLPPGVAYSLEANQLIRIEMHYINTSETTQEVTASTTFVEIPEADFEHEADFLFVGNPDIEIQPMSEFVLGPSFLPLPADLVGINVFAITGHEHKWGTGVEVAVAESVDGPDSMIYKPEPFIWDEPDTVYLDPPVTLDGASGFRFTCEFYNGSNEIVGFGESANDEMCFFWAYYYPSQGAKVCMHSDEYGVNVCCPGDGLCALLDGL